MISVRYSDVPEYLRRSELFRTFDTDDELPRSVPSGCFKRDTVIDSEDSFMHILRTMQYWIVHEPPREVLCFVLACDVGSIRNTNPVLWRLFRTFDFATKFIELSAAEPHQRMELAIESGMKDYILTDLHVLGHKFPSKAFTIAAKYNRIDALNLARALECEATLKAAYYCSMHGNLEFLQYFHSRALPFSSKCVAVAAKQGHLLCLEYFHGLGLPFGTDALSRAAENGRFDCLRFMLQRDEIIDSSVVVAAARARDAACLQYLVEYGAPMTAEVTVAACEDGRLECLLYAVQQGCPLTKEACIAAAANGHALCLRVVVQAGAPLCKEVCESAALHGHEQCLYEAHSCKCPWDEKTLANANWSGSFSCQWYLRKNGCPCHAHCRWKSAFFIEMLLLFFVAGHYPRFVEVCFVLLLAVQLHAAADLLGLYTDLLEPHCCLPWRLLRCLVLVAARVYTIALIVFPSYWLIATVCA